MSALCWNGVNDLAGDRQRPRDRQPPRRDPQGPADHDLRVGPALHRRLHPDDARGRRHRPRVHGRGRRGRARGQRLKVGDRVVVPSFIGCGRCWYCEHDLCSLCDNTNPKPELQSPAAGPAHRRDLRLQPRLRRLRRLARRVHPRAVHADVRLLPRPGGRHRRAGAVPLRRRAHRVTWAPTSATSQRGDTVAVWGCGGVGLMAQRSAQLHGRRAGDRDRPAARAARAGARARRRGDDRLLAGGRCSRPLREMTGGRGPDTCIEAVGMEAHGTGAQYAYDRVKQALRLETDRAHRPARGHHGLPQGRHRLRPRRLRGDRQVPDRRRS